MNRILYVILLSILITSCHTQEKILYFQNIDEIITENPANYNSPAIQSGDLLSIVVSSYHQDAVRPFNLIVGNGRMTGQVTSSQNGLQNYLVDGRGKINFPVLGEIQVAGKTRQELSDELQLKIQKYVKEPIVTIRILNFRYTVLGEVNSPGVFQAENEKVTILEALGSARDLTMYGERDSIILLRTENNLVKKHYVNLKDASLIDSSYFYLRQNDVVYVQPSNIKTRESQVSPFNNLIISGISITLALLTLLTR